MKLSFFGENKKFRRKNMKKYFALLLAVMLVFSCALPTISADDVQNDTEITESTASEPQVLADPSSEPIPLNSCAHENKEFVEAQEPTCTDTGNVAYYHCPDCDSNLDENGNVLETVELPTAPHVPTGEMYNADYTPCGGGYKTDYYFCVYCNSIIDSDGNILDWFPAETNKHTPGGKNYGADYKPCRGGYKEDYYYCIYCGSVVNADGNHIEWFAYDPDAVHTPGTNKHSATYVPCDGGYKTDFYSCINCGRAVDSDGKLVDYCLSEENAQHVLSKNSANYKPCKGGFKEDWYECAVCGSCFMDKDGNNATYYDPDENAKHTPGTILHKANYTSCGGGYKENFYYCMDCGAAIDGNGNPINPCDPENSIHTPSTEVYPADYTICNGGYKTEYHKCIYCGSAVNAEGKYATWYGGSYYETI